MTAGQLYTPVVPPPCKLVTPFPLEEKLSSVTQTVRTHDRTSYGTQLTDTIIIRK